MTNSINFKIASLEDLDAIIQVGDELFDHAVKPQLAREFLNDPRHHMALAYQGSDLIGMASGLDYIHPDKEPALFINEVGVVDKHQNQGIGRSLVQLLCKHGKKMGLKEAWVATESSNMAARKAYINAGGVEEGEPIVLIEFSL